MKLLTLTSDTSDVMVRCLVSDGDDDDVLQLVFQVLHAQSFIHVTGGFVLAEQENAQWCHFTPAAAKALYLLQMISHFKSNPEKLVDEKEFLLLVPPPLESVTPLTFSPLNSSTTLLLCT